MSLDNENPVETIVVLSKGVVKSEKNCVEPGLEE